MNKTNLILDLGIFTAFLVASAPCFTGEPIHEWLSLALSVTLLAHILLHWKWVVTVGATFFKNLWHSSRLQFVVDILVFAAFITVMVSGIMISRTVVGALGIQLAGGGSWTMIHKFSADAALYLTGLHFALHWNWIVCMMKKVVSSPIASAFKPRLQVKQIPVKDQGK